MKKLKRKANRYLYHNKNYFISQVIDFLNSRTLAYIIVFLAIITGILIFIDNIYNTNDIDFEWGYEYLIYIIIAYVSGFVVKYIRKENDFKWEKILLDSRVFFSFALFCLVLTVVYLIWDESTKAEDFSIYAYYFLVLWVIYEIIISKFIKD